MSFSYPNTLKESESYYFLHQNPMQYQLKKLILKTDTYKQENFQ